MMARSLLGAVLPGLLLGLAACNRDPKAPLPRVEIKTPAKEEPTGPPLFEEITPDSGIAFTYRNGEDTANHLTILESLGGGGGAIDYDGDGLIDVFLTGGGGFAGTDKKNIVGFPSKLYRNLGKGKFQDVSAAVGVDKLAGGKPWFYTHGVAVADVDRDGWPDLLVTGWAQVALFRNVPVDPAKPEAGRRFEDVTARAGLDKGIDWGTSAAFADFDGDGYPDLYLCQYVDWSWKKNPPCNYDGKTPDVCPPRNFAGLPHLLFRNNGKGGFVDVSKEAGLKPGSDNSSKGLGVVVVDVDGDHKPDIYVCNDTVDNFLYMNQSKPGQLRFEEQGLTSGVARDDRGTPNGSMGVDAGDPERTGRPSIWVTNYENELHSFYKNECKPGFVFFNYHTQAAGIAALGQTYVGWGTAFIDVDLDGWEDIFVSNGHAIRFPTGKGVSRLQRPVLLHNQRGRFTNISKRVGSYGEKQHLGRGVIFADLDNDGRMDLVLVNCNEPTAVVRGVGGEGKHWLGVTLQRKDHADVIGTRVTITTPDGKQTRFAKGGGSYASSNDHRLLFGLNQLEKVSEVEIHWPDGEKQVLKDLPADRYHVIKQDPAKGKS